MQNKTLFPISYPIGRAWYVLELRSYSERLDLYGRLEFDAKTGLFEIEKEIAKLGFDGYVPKEKRFIRRRGRQVKIINALIPGYAFVFFDADRDEWEKLLDIDGVIDVLQQNEIPVRIGGKDTGVIDRIRRAEMAGAFDYTIPTSAYGVGDRVEIKEGPFAGLIAKIKSATAKKRVKIIMDFFGTVEIDPCFLVKAV